MKRIAIFASGSGSNAENIVHYFNNSAQIKVVLIFTNNVNAKVIERAKNLSVSYQIFNKYELNESEAFLAFLVNEVDYIVLAGFLWLIPKRIIEKFPQKIINIHPALLPKYGGKGMFGMNIHKAVFNNNEKESGITIHFVNENYDEGDIIFQEKVLIDLNDTPDSVADKIHQLEYNYFPKVIETVILKNEF